LKLPGRWLFCWLAGISAPVFAGPALLIAHVNVIDATGAPPQADRAVLIVDGRIAGIGDPEKTPMPPGAQLIDGRGKFLIPGLWDMHVHLLRRGWPEAYFPLLIANGVTGMRDMGGNFSFDEIAQLRREIASGHRLGPQFVAAGPILDGPYPQLPSISVVVADAAAAYTQVDLLAQQGADFIKVYNRLSREAYFAIATEAAKQHIPFAGHVPFSVSAREASDAGQSSIEHLFNVLFACSSREDELMRIKARSLASDESGERQSLRRLYLHGVLDSYSEPRCAELYTHFVRNQTWQTPTLVQRRAFAYPDASLAADPNRRYVPRAMRALWDPQQDRRLQGRDADDEDMQRRYYEKDRALIAPMRRAGVGILAGTDAGDPFSIPGFSLHQELQMLVDAGLTPMEALQSATRNAAQFLHREAQFGTIAPGLRADLLLLDRNPLADIRNTQAIAAVIVGGRYLRREDLDRLLLQAQAAADSQ
jgi:imidazolonepropionase-like amidohydrolase